MCQAVPKAICAAAGMCAPVLYVVFVDGVRPALGHQPRAGRLGRVDGPGQLPLPLDLFGF